MKMSFSICHKINLWIFLGVLIAGGLASAETALNKKVACAVYITGIGCGNCAITDPALFVNAVTANPNLVIFEYEIYRSQKANQKTTDAYFRNYLPAGRVGVPFFIINKNKTFIGRFNVLKAIEEILSINSNDFPKEDGTSVSFNELDITKLPGHVNIWTKNRVFIKGENGDDKTLKKLIMAEDISEALQDVNFTKVKPISFEISQDKIIFQHAVMVGGWRLQWNGSPAVLKPKESRSVEYGFLGLLISLTVLLLALSFFKVSIRKVKKGMPVKFELRSRMRDIVIASISFLAIASFFFFAKNISPNFLESAGYRLPLPIFTLLIAAADSFNPCNMFVLTCLLTLLISTSQARMRLYVVGISFVGVCFIFYFLFMAAWLNVFQYIGFVSPLRIGIALIALVAGFINCKELFFFKQGISLTIQEQHKGPLMRKIQAMKEVIQKGSFPMLLASSIGLATLSSLVELPCTAGFPLIYTSILSGKGLEKTVSYYLYLAYYNIIYVIPLLVITFIFIYTFRAKQINQRQMEVIKFIGGIIMILLGIILLVNPGLIGLSL
jgi:hypothetical protein